MLVCYRVGNTYSLSSIADIYYSALTGVIEFTPVSDNIESFYINGCSYDDFYTISTELRKKGFIDLYAFHYEVFYA